MAKLKNKSSLGCDSLSRLDRLVYLCRKCFESYKGYFKKRDSSGQLTENAVDFVPQTMNGNITPRHHGSNGNALAGIRTQEQVHSTA